MSNPETVGIRIDAIYGTDWAAFREAVLASTHWEPETGVLAYVESPERCELVSTAAGELTEVAGAWCGRIFDATHEVRWERLPDGFRGWTTYESSDEPTFRGIPSTRTYILLGQYTGRDENSGAQMFSEARFPDHPFRYPLGGCEKEDSAGVTVVEYRRIPPTWEATATVAELAGDLSRRRLLAHRFSGLVRVEKQ